MSFEPLIRAVPDFPQPGVVFRDITPLLADAGAFARCVDALAAPWRGQRIAAGDMAGMPAAPAALAHGFGWITLYGGLSVCLLAFASLMLFGVPAAGRNRRATGAG